MACSSLSSETAGGMDGGGDSLDVVAFFDAAFARDTGFVALDAAALGTGFALETGFALGSAAAALEAGFLAGGFRADETGGGAERRSDSWKWFSGGEMYSSSERGESGSASSVVGGAVAS